MIHLAVPACFYASQLELQAIYRKVIKSVLIRAYMLRNHRKPRWGKLGSINLRRTVPGWKVKSVFERTLNLIKIQIHIRYKSFTAPNKNTETWTRYHRNNINLKNMYKKSVDSAQKKSALYLLQMCVDFWAGSLKARLFWKSCQQTYPEYLGTNAALKDQGISSSLGSFLGRPIN